MTGYNSKRHKILCFLSKHKFCTWLSKLACLRACTMLGWDSPRVRATSMGVPSGVRFMYLSCSGDIICITIHAGICICVYIHTCICVRMHACMHARFSSQHTCAESTHCIHTACMQCMLHMYRLYVLYAHMYLCMLLP